MKQLLPVFLCGVLSLPAIASAPDEPVVTIQMGNVVRPVEKRVIGLDLNYICDNADVRKAGQGLDAVLQQLGVASLRYPGGEKSDGYLWSIPPFDKPRPTLARVGTDEWPSSDAKWVRADGKTFIHRPMDFDEFMTISRKLGATPTIVIAYDSIYKPAPPGGIAPTKKQLLATAVAWVRYANIEKKYGIKYWEIGNESFNASYNGGATAANYARDLKEFARAMKEVDPSILIGANVPESANKIGDYDLKAGSKVPWWKTVLENAAPSIDFLALHTYPVYGWKSFDDYSTHIGQLTLVTSEARKALRRWASPADAARIRFAVTEFNAVNYKGFPATTIGWQNENNLGHALVDFDLIGDWLLDPKVDMAGVWTSRWTHNDTWGVHEVYDTFDAKNRLLPTGMAMALWPKYLKDQMNAVSSSNPAIRAFGSSSEDGSKWSLFLINTTKKPVPVHISEGLVHLGDHPQVVVFSGRGPNDASPKVEERGDFLQQSGASLQGMLPPVSLTIISSP